MKSILGFLLILLIQTAAIAAAASPAAASPAIAQDKINTGCQRCKFTGSLPCPKHNKTAAKIEEEAIFCSIAARCPVCKGTFVVDCPDCKGNDGEASVENAHAEAQRWLEKEANFEKNMGGPTRARVITKHFDLTFEVESLTVGRNVLDQHQLLHLYAQRLETLLADFNEILGTRETDHKCPRFLVMVWKSPVDNREAATRYADSGGSGTGVKLLGSKGVYTMVRDRNLHAQDDDLHRSIVHNVTHLLLADLFDAVWIGNRKGGWLDEGLAHWFEDKYFGQCTNFCYQEQNTLIAFKGGKWRMPVRAMVEINKMPPFAETGSKMSDQLTAAEHALAFSYVDFLLHRDPKLLPKVAYLYQKKKETREALEPYALSVNELEVQWKKWVLDKYTDRTGPGLK
ncbi:MAG: hypothetical protein HY286_17670 [Planctomycetes bacterium]|nr:hypothetical protein [Planctomycetota bacterium]